MGLPQNISTTVSSVMDRYRVDKPPNNGTLNFPVADTGQTPVRGLLVPQVDAGRTLPLDRAVIFQFNPEEINYEKTMNWATHQRTGFAYEIPFWVLGGAKVISFKLMMDATAGSNYRLLKSSKSGNKNTNITGGPYVNFDDYNVTIDGEGVDGLLPEIQKLEAMQYPIDKNTNDTVGFKNGLPNVLSLTKFANPPFIIFNYGNVYAVTFLSALRRRDMLFNRMLNPIRTEFDVTLSVHEARTVNPNLIVSPLTKQLPLQINDTRPQSTSA